MTRVRPLRRYYLTATLIATCLCSVASDQTSEAVRPSIVTLNVLVTDNAKRPVTNLTEKDFLVFDDGKQQTISFFEKEDIPVSYGLIVDNTGSMRPSAEATQLVARTILGNHRPQDKAFMVRLVDGHGERIADWTSDKTILLYALSAMTRGSGGVPLIDSIRDCSEYVGRDRASRDIAKQRRSIILVTDGLERDSKTTMAQLLQQLHKDNVQVFAVGIHPPKQGAVPRRRFPVEQSISFLNTLTKETGGRSLFPKSESELRESADLISSYLRAQYVIGYSTAQSAGEGSFREILVSLSNVPRPEDYLVSARRRYAVSAPQSPH